MIDDTDLLWIGAAIFGLWLISSDVAAADSPIPARAALATGVAYDKGYVAPSIRFGRDGGLGVRLGAMHPLSGAQHAPDDLLSYVEVDQELCGDRWCFGMGVARMNITTYMNGTKWNFGLHIRYRFDRHWSAVADHYSHGSAVGIADDKKNRGWNLIGVAYSF